ncbi:hypothetical protein [Flavivirga jejuensis]|uniref:Uncharacterized protein n=1 Tax=Flavivirga jejuensis TaxID=870487 RepID=A0ABT8WVP0_9FLAO|nr:hypothetical protein [Flavivirga jejuensis]MDO5977079.1 hypothetical protein [Flavivirga jejuensis]
MIDNIKFSITDKERLEIDLENNNLITLKSSFDRITGEANEYPKIGTYKNLQIRITPTTTTIKGSIHKYYNIVKGKGNQNHSDFSFKQWEFAINHLCEKLQINKEKTKITNLEFGFNIEVNRSPKSIIDYQILMYNFQDHNRNHNYRGKGSYKEFEKTDYSIKVYDKSKQYLLLDKRLLRIELKIVNSRYLKKIGIVNLNQFGKSTFKTLFNCFLIHFNKLMIVDSIMAPKGIRDDQMFLFKMCVNPNHWNSIDNIEKKETKREFIKLIKKYNHDKTHSLLRDIIINKFKILMS